MHTICEDVKKLKHVKTTKIMLTPIHLNYKFKTITLKNIYIHGLSDCLAKGGVKILDGMKCSQFYYYYYYYYYLHFFYSFFRSSSPKYIL